MNKLKLKIITPEKLIYEDVVDQVTLPTTEGEITILPNHVPLIAGLGSGDIVAVKGGEHIPFAVTGGFVEIKNDEVTPHIITSVAILADFAEHVSDISAKEIAKAKARAEELKQQAENKEAVDFEHFEAELERSLNRVKVADKWRNKKYLK